MTTTARLGLPLLAPEQAQKHITHNEALVLLDALVQLRLDGVDTVSPPGAPAEGETHAIGLAATNAWDGHDGEIACWTEGGWRFAVPVEGWLAWDAGAGSLLVFRGGGWVPFSQSLSRVGIGADADATNRLLVRSEAALFTAIDAGSGGNGDVRLTLNKETAGDSATLLFQSGWSGRAEIGLSGNDDFAFKVSADGSSFTTAFTLDADAGFVSFGRMTGAVPSYPTVAAGELTVETSYAVPAPESGTSDDVDTISGGFDGAVLIVTGTAGNTLTFRDGTGNLKLGADRVLDNFEDSLMLVRRGSDWIELSYADNG
ncbi:DUF2793 domain-containing protein [Pelagibacterium xiamenense]|uniref:DUF2793 domain-containing protein n=1 Tax=Pelagibacterium xiamenense TaxID=2901140 RepID=UPI001E3EA8C4|nr:DUF2793 domain-containing protein [Pelagibacterium xiamenense]MCD7059502.1 DUF2793 domain-containing protein [Pelagibacterium xiamenense]